MKKIINEKILRRIIEESVKDVLKNIKEEENDSVTTREIKEPFLRMRKAIDDFLNLFYVYMKDFAYDEEKAKAKAAADALFKGLLAVEGCFRHPEGTRGEKVWDPIINEPTYGSRDW